MSICNVFFYDKQTNEIIEDFTIDFQEISDIYNFVEDYIKRYNVDISKIGFITLY